MQQELGGKIALVTGASAPRGIGRQTALTLAALGADIVITDVSVSPALEKVAGEIRGLGQRCLTVALDVRDLAEIEACVAKVVATFGGLDILVNNAGTTIGAAPYLEIEAAHFDESYQINLRGPALLSQRFIPVMIQRGGGCIINNASTAGLGAEVGFGAYTASKHALIGLTKTIAAEFGPQNIRCNAVCPGYTQTDMHMAVNERLAKEEGLSVAEIQQRRYAAVALRRAATPEEVAEVIAFLASPRSAYISGAAIPLSGAGPYGI